LIRKKIKQPVIIIASVNNSSSSKLSAMVSEEKSILDKAMVKKAFCNQAIGFSKTNWVRPNCQSFPLKVSGTNRKLKSKKTATMFPILFFISVKPNF
jgi:hypothetical protein